jgi:hypothetical protein
VNHTLCRAASIASAMRRKADAPSISGRTALPVRTGYEPEAGKGMRHDRLKCRGFVQ